MTLNKRNDIQVNYPGQGWTTVCTVDSLQEHIFLEFVCKEWAHLDVRVTAGNNEKIVWKKLKGVLNND